MKKRYVLFVSMLVVVNLLSPLTFVHAAKKRVRVPRAVGLSYSKASLLRPTHSIFVTFINLNKVKRIAYTLNYTANGISQGVMGSFVPSGQTTNSRDLYFGTCSKGVCTPHYGIRDATLMITTTLTSGGVTTKRYVLKNV